MLKLFWIVLILVVETVLSWIQWFCVMSHSQLFLLLFFCLLVVTIVQRECKSSDKCKNRLEWAKNQNMLSASLFPLNFCVKTTNQQNLGFQIYNKQTSHKILANINHPHLPPTARSLNQKKTVRFLQANSNRTGSLLIPMPKATVATTTWIWPSTQAVWTLDRASALSSPW